MSGSGYEKCGLKMGMGIALAWKMADASRERKRQGDDRDSTASGLDEVTQYIAVYFTICHISTCSSIVLINVNTGSIMSVCIDLRVGLVLCGEANTSTHVAAQSFCCSLSCTFM